MENVKGITLLIVEVYGYEMRCPSPIVIKNPAKRPDSFYTAVPCGRCGACKFNRRVDWSFRIKEEYRNSINGFFITLTYNDENVPIGNDCVSLCKTDLQKFIKRLRKRNSVRMRYYGIGEYGSETKRPHYHLIAFNCDLDNILDLSSVWSVNGCPLGNVYVGDVSDASIHYCTKFHVNISDEKPKDKEPEFAIMSRKPGIGKSYVDRAREYHKETKNNFVRNNGFKQRLPRFLKDKIFSEAEKRAIRWLSQKEIQKIYEKEYRRLKLLGIDDPDMYMENVDFQESLKVTRKFKKKDKI